MDKEPVFESLLARVRILGCTLFLVILTHAASAQDQQILVEPHRMIPWDQESTNAVALGDVDGDGDLDVFMGNCIFFLGNYPPIPQQNRLCLNDGNGVFIDATSQLPSIIDKTSSVALGDVDGDGDLDVLSVNYRYNRLYSNLSRQIAWRGVPRIGKRLVMDVYGPANGWWSLAASRWFANMATPYGDLRIYPGGIIYRSSGKLDSSGRSSVAFDVPALPVLVGMSLYWQAVVGPQPKITNLEITTFTDL